MPARRVLPASLSLLAAAVLAACGASHHSAPAPSAAALLARARRVVDATHAMHFVLTSTGVSKSSTELVGGTGDLVRPDSLKGSFTVSEQGVQASVKAIAAAGAFYAELPFTSNYAEVDPARYGLGDPTQLLDPRTGVTALLTDAAPHARRTATRRLSGELVDVVTGTVPGSRLPVLPDADPRAPVTLTAAIDPATGQLRQVTISGPLTSASTTTTYTVTLTRYGEHVTVTPPPKQK